VRQRAATSARSDATARLAEMKEHMARLESANQQEELTSLKEMVLDRGRTQPNEPRSREHNERARSGDKNKGSRLTSIKSSDGWLIYLGRNKMENDLLITKMAQPQDLWMHVQGHEGSHVLIKNPNRRDPPFTTLKAAAQIAARFSKVSLGSKVRVVYTYCKFVRKLAKDKPGLVAYENEKTLEINTAEPMPANLRKLFSK